MAIKYFPCRKSNEQIAWAECRLWVCRRRFIWAYSGTRVSNRFLLRTTNNEFYAKYNTTTISICIHPFRIFGLNYLPWPPHIFAHINIFNRNRAMQCNFKVHVTSASPATNTCNFIVTTPESCHFLATFISMLI